MDCNDRPHFEILEGNADEFFSEDGPGPGDMPGVKWSAARRKLPSSPREIPASQQPKPVTIDWHGGAWYSIGGGKRRQLTPREDGFLQAFVGCDGPMDTATIRDVTKGDVRRPNDVIRQLLRKLPEFSPAIDHPGRKGNGYFVRVRKGERAESA
jgi:hypothetical protein